jgi:hypothetical protein
MLYSTNGVGRQNEDGLTEIAKPSPIHDDWITALISSSWENIQVSTNGQAYLEECILKEQKWKIKSLLIEKIICIYLAMVMVTIPGVGRRFPIQWSSSRR